MGQNVAFFARKGHLPIFSITLKRINDIVKGKQNVISMNKITKISIHINNNVLFKKKNRGSHYPHSPMVIPSMVRRVLDTYSEKGKKSLGMNSYMLDVRTRCDRSQFEFHNCFFFF